MKTSRLEAFSDGVIAIIITIMVLELKVPHGTDLAALGDIVNHATTWGLGTPIAWRMATNAPGPLDSLANACCMNP